MIVGTVQRMQRLDATDALDDALEVYEAYRPERPGAFLRINMVASLDGRIAGADGVSGTLGGEGDRAAFLALRHHADGILAGAGTVRAEDYGAMRVRDELAAARAADGRPGPAPIVVVTASVDLDPSARLFTVDGAAPIVVTTEDAPQDRVAAVEGAGARIVRAGRGRVDLPSALTTLREHHGLAHLLCEGGPSLNGQLLAEGLVDELCMTLAPSVVGGQDDKRIVDGLDQRVSLTLTHVLKDGEELLLRYRCG